MLNRSILATLLLVLPAAGATAGLTHEKAAGKQEIKQDYQLIKQTRKTLNELNRAIDLWHDANLKGDDRKIAFARKKIEQILQADITASWDRIGESEIEVYQSAEELKATPSNGTAHKDGRVDLRDDIKDLKQARIVLKTKERLYSSIDKSSAFSNKYRLLSDYADVLKKQLGLTRIELAEDRANPTQDKQPSFKR